LRSPPGLRSLRAPSRRKPPGCLLRSTSSDFLDRGLAPGAGALGGAEDQLQHRAAFFDAVDRPLVLRQTLGEMHQFGLERVQRLKFSPGRLSRAGRQMIKRVFRSENLSLLANQVNLMRAVRKRECPTGE